MRKSVPGHRKFERGGLIPSAAFESVWLTLSKHLSHPTLFSIISHLFLPISGLSSPLPWEGIPADWSPFHVASAHLSFSRSLQIISRPAGDEGALHAFCSILSGPPGPRPEKLLPRISTPILLVWGDRDTFIPVDGPIGRFFTALPKTNPNVELTVIKGGHCPHDDMHDLFHDAVLPWLEKVTKGSTPVLAQS